MSDYSTTGDGLMAGLQFLAEIVRTGTPASQLINVFDPVPQFLKNVRFTPSEDPLNAPKVQQQIYAAEAALGDTGRLLIRKSGTEPLIRVMAECEDQALLIETVDGICAAVESASAAA
jgi:phosphoglucosamine mutase